MVAVTIMLKISKKIMHFATVITVIMPPKCASFPFFSSFPVCVVVLCVKKSLRPGNYAFALIPVFDTCPPIVGKMEILKFIHSHTQTSFTDTYTTDTALHQCMPTKAKPLTLHFTSACPPKQNQFFFSNV